jgi:hypothetical protein
MWSGLVIRLIPAGVSIGRAGIKGQSRQLSALAAHVPKSYVVPSVNESRDHLPVSQLGEN